MAITLANALLARGRRVDILVGTAEGPYRDLVASSVRVIDLKRRRVSRCLAGLVRYLRKERPAMLISVMSEANVVACVARLLAGGTTRLVVTEHNNLTLDLADSGFRATLFKQVLRLTYPIAHSIVGVSKGVSDDLEQALRLRRGTVRTIYNPIVDGAAPVTRSPKAPGAGTPLIVAAGRLKKQKDYPTLLRAFAMLRQRRDAELAILGEGPLRGELEHLCDMLGIAEHVRLPGFSDDVAQWMARADLFVLSSAWEGFGNVIVEAMACGTPIVATDCPSGPAEILEDGKWGRLVPVGDAAALAAAMAASLDDSSPPDVMARAAAFSVDRAVDAYLTLLDPVAASDRGELRPAASSPVA